MKEKEQLIQLLVDLNDVYKGVRGNILISRPLPNVSEAYYMLLQEEHQREMSSEVHMMPQSATLFNANTNSQDFMGLVSRNAGYNNLGNKASGYNGNFSGNNGFSNNGNNSFPPPQSAATRRQLFCDHCKLTGHTVQKCCKLHGYPPGHILYRGKRVAASITQEQDGVSWLEDTQCKASNQEPALALPTLNTE